MHSPCFGSCFKQATLKVRGKALSTEQKAKVVGKTQTENPLYLKILLEVSDLLWISFVVRTESKCGDTTVDTLDVRKPVPEHVHVMYGE